MAFEMGIVFLFLKAARGVEAFLVTSGCVTGHGLSFGGRLGAF